MAVNKAARVVGSVVDQIIATGTVTAGAPTVAELTAGTSVRMECHMIPGSLSHPRTGQTADISSACESESSSIRARVENGDASAMYYYESPDGGEAWSVCDDTISPTPTLTEVVCRAGFSGAAGAPLAGDVVEIRTIQITARALETPTGTDAQRFSATWAVMSTEFDVVVVA